MLRTGLSTVQFIQNVYELKSMIVSIILNDVTASRPLNSKRQLKNIFASKFILEIATIPLNDVNLMLHSVCKPRFINDDSFRFNARMLLYSAHQLAHIHDIVIFLFQMPKYASLSNSTHAKLLESFINYISSFFVAPYIYVKRSIYIT